MEALLRAHADINGAYGGGYYSTPLMVACNRGQAACAELLLAWGARDNVFVEGEAKKTALDFAVQCKLPGGQECEALLKRCEEDEEFLRSELAHVLRSEQRPKSAAKLKKLDLQQKKMEEERLQRIGERFGASSVEKADTVLQLRLRLALSLGDDAFIAKWLRDGGREALHKPCLKDTWILTTAAAHGCSPIVERLLEARASPDPPEDAIGNFPLLASCSSGSVACIEALLEHRADPQRSRSSDGRTAMEQAVFADHEECKSFFSTYESAKVANAQLAARFELQLSQALSDVEEARDSPDADFEALLESLRCTIKACEKGACDRLLKLARVLCEDLQKAAKEAARQQAVQGAVAALRSAYERARAHEDAAGGAEAHAGEAEVCLAALKQSISEHAERLHASSSAEATQLLLDAKALRERLAS